MAMTAKELVLRGSDILSRKKEFVNINIEEVGVWRFRVPTADDINDNKVYFENHKHEARNGDVVHVYRQCVEPNLKDPELCAYLAPKVGRKDAPPGPWVVDALLKPGEITSIVEIFYKQLGYLTETAHIVSDEESRVIGEGYIAQSEFLVGEEVKNA